MVLLPARDIARLVKVLRTRSVLDTPRVEEADVERLKTEKAELEKKKEELEKQTAELGVQVATIQAEKMQLTTDLATQKSLVEVERGAAQMYREEGKRLHKVAQVSAGKAELAAVEFTTIKNDLNSEVGDLKRKIASLDESLGIAEKAQDELQEKYTKLKRRMEKKGVRMESTDDELEAAMNAPEADDYDDDM